MGTLELINKVKNMTDEELRAELDRLDKLEESANYETFEDKEKNRRYYNRIGLELRIRENAKND